MADPTDVYSMGEEQGLHFDKSSAEVTERGTGNKESGFFPSFVRKGTRPWKSAAKN